MAMDMATETRCPLCGACDLIVRHQLPHPDYQTVRCVACHFTFMHPYPSDEFLDVHYKQRPLYGLESGKAEYYSRAIADRGGLIAALLSRIPEAPRHGRAIDVGAGIGIAVAALRDIGFDAIGLEKNPGAATAGRQLFDVEITDRMLDEVPEGVNLFTMFEVLEHIKHPAKFVRILADKLSSGGCLIGSVPNYDGLGRYLHDTGSIALGFPEHINQFTRPTLGRTLEAGGLGVVYIGFPPPYGVSLTLGLRKSMRRRFGEGALARTAVGVLTFMKKYLVYPPLNIFAETTGLLGHGLVFIARKPDISGTPLSP